MKMLNEKIIRGQKHERLYSRIITYPVYTIRYTAFCPVSLVSLNIYLWLVLLMHYIPLPRDDGFGVCNNNIKQQTPVDLLEFQALSPNSVFVILQKLYHE